MSGPPPTSALIDVIVLVFSKSELKSLVGTDALKTVLEGTRALFPEPETLDLQPVYELLESQPGFDPDKAVAPFCRLKTWEVRLRTKILMPAALAEVDMKTCEIKAMNVNAFDSDLDKLLAPPAPKAAPVARIVESSSATKSPVVASNRKVKIAMLAAFIGLAAAGVSIYLTFYGGPGGNTVRISPKDLSDAVPFDSVRKSGDVMIGTVSDPAWMQKSEFERRQQLEGVVPKMRLQQVKTLLLVDKKGAAIGSVVVKGAPVISFMPQRAPKK